MKRWIPFLLIYVLVHSTGNPDTVRQYDGQSQATIASLLAGESKTGDFITQQQYQDFIIANTPAPLTPAELTASLRATAIDDLNTDPQPGSKLQRAVLLVTLDEINVIRGLLVPAQNPRTIAQFKNAVQSKINSGAAD